MGGAALHESTSALPDASLERGEDWVWKLLLALRVQAGGPGSTGARSFGIASDGSLGGAADSGSPGRVRWSGSRWETGLDVSEPLLDLYLPLCQPLNGRPRLLGHLGQSIDGYIATASGDSGYVNDPENIRHLHRLRALHDAVVVGAGTIAADNPRLTTRRVEGPSPVRVVLDPRRRLPATAGVFSDSAAETVLVVAESTGGASRHGQAEVLFVPAKDHVFDLRVLVGRLAERGLERIFVEGGGATVSSFLEAGLLDRLQIAVAPVLTGRGRPGLRLPPQARMQDCPRPVHRAFEMGQDILFDCELRGSGSSAQPSPGEAEAARQERTESGLRRIR